MEARIILTHNCNYGCWFCHGEGWKEKKSGFIDKEMLFLLLDYLEQQFDLTNITLSGGEPLLHPQVKDIIDYISEKSIKVSLVTNGTLVRTQISALENVDLINFSIHTLNPHIYLNNSGGKVSVKDAINSLQMLQNIYPNKKIRVNIVVDDYFINNMQTCLIKLANLNEIKLIELFPCNNTELMLENVEKKLIELGYSKKENILNRRKKVYYKDKQILYLTRIFCAQVKKNKFGKSYCAENNEINISPNFVIKKCRFQEGNNIHEFIKSKNIDKLNKIINNIISLEGVECKYE